MTYTGFAHHVWKDGATAFHHIYTNEVQVICCGVRRPIVPVVIEEVAEDEASYWLVIHSQGWWEAKKSRHQAELHASKGETILPVSVSVSPEYPSHPGMFFEQAAEIVMNGQHKGMRRPSWKPDTALTLSCDGLYRTVLKRVSDGYWSYSKQLTPGTLPDMDDHDRVDWEVVDLKEGD